MNNKNLHKCHNCGKIATWQNKYPNKHDRAKYYCEDCVPRGSLENVDNIDDFGEPNPNRKVMWWGENSKANDLLRDGSLTREKDSFYYEELDENGKRMPPDDFIYSKKGFKKSDNITEYYITYKDIIDNLDESSKNLTLDEEFEIQDKAIDIFVKIKDKKLNNIAKYNVFMSKFGNFMVDYATMYNSIHKIEIFRKFYNTFKKKISTTKAII